MYWFLSNAHRCLEGSAPPNPLHHFYNAWRRNSLSSHSFNAFHWLFNTHSHPTNPHQGHSSFGKISPDTSVGDFGSFADIPSKDCCSVFANGRLLDRRMPFNFYTTATGASISYGICIFWNSTLCNTVILRDCGTLPCLWAHIITNQMDWIQTRKFYQIKRCWHIQGTLDTRKLCRALLSPIQPSFFLQTTFKTQSAQKVSHISLFPWLMSL